MKPDECPSPNDCISKIYQVIDRTSSPGQYPSLKEQSIIIKLLELGDDAMPFIIKLLDEDDELISRVGAVALREAKSIDAKYLPNIIKGLEKDVSWLAPALAKIGTPEAAEVAVKQYLVSKSAPHNQEAYALELFGKRAFPAILKAARCEFGCNANTYYLLGYASGEMESDREEAARLLIGVVEDASLPESIRLGVLQMISYLEKPGLVVEANLLKIKENEPLLEDAVNHALIGIKSKHSGRIYAEMLDKEVDRYKLRDVAELGRSGYDAGETITRQLKNNDFEIKLLAARTLGFIEYVPAAHRLIQLLDAHSSVQLNWVAAESLGRMKSELAIPALKATAEGHWYPPVRDAARKAIEHIKTGENYENEFHKSNFAFDYFSYQQFGLETCEKIALAPTPEPKDHKLYKSNAKEELDSLAYPSVILSYGANDEAQQQEADPNGIIVVNEHNIVENREEIKQVPRVALRVGDGWLAGSNRGEWGGELVYIADNGNVTEIINSNIEDIYKLGDRYIAITGLAHLTMNNGMIYELFQAADGNWRAKEWLALPGSPRTSWFVETGEILINTSGGGSILLSQNGSMRMAECE